MGSSHMICNLVHTISAQMGGVTHPNSEFLVSVVILQLVKEEWTSTELSSVVAHYTLHTVSAKYIIGAKWQFLPERLA
jgi:predicted metalloprotease with PDZ domain